MTIICTEVTKNGLRSRRKD